MKITCLLFWIGVSLCMHVKVEMKRLEYNVTYFATGQSITLQCNCKVLFWNGPATTNTGNQISTAEINDIYGDPKIMNITIYMQRGRVSDMLPDNLFKRLSVTGDNLNLHLKNSTISDEGLYICDLQNYCFMQHVYQSVFLLQNKLLPSELKILNTTQEYIVNGTENRPLHLVCLVKRGKPPALLRWKKNGTIIRQGGTSKLAYSLTPTISDHQSIYTCEAQNTDMTKPLTKSIHLDIKYKPTIKLNISGTVLPVEGETTHICCTSMSNPKPKIMCWNKDDKKLVAAYNTFSLCYTMSNVSRNDTGHYVCSSQNEIGEVSGDIPLIISYPPVIRMRYRNLTVFRRNREIECVAKGEPHTYDYFQWEHQSIFDEHIRYLGETNDGILRLPEMNESNIYQDTGFYICNVSNRIPDYRGNVFQLGAPVFAADNKRMQLSNKEEAVEIIVKVYSPSVITCYNITKVGGMSVQMQDLEVEMEHIQMNEIFHNANVTVKGLKFIFVLNLRNFRESHTFNVTVCNSYGQSSFIVNSEQFGSITNSTHRTLPTAIIVTTVILTFLLVPLVIKFLFIIRDRSNDINTEEESEEVEGLSASVENVLYQSRYAQNNESSVSQTPQQELMDDVTLTGPDSRMYNPQQNQEFMDDQLNYADVVFQPSLSTNEVRILGLEDRIHYADVDVSARTAFPPDISSERSSSEEDFVYVDQIENYMPHRTTNI